MYSHQEFHTLNMVHQKYTNVARNNSRKSPISCHKSQSEVQKYSSMFPICVDLLNLTGSTPEKLEEGTNTWSNSLMKWGGNICEVLHGCYGLKLQYQHIYRYLFKSRKSHTVKYCGKNAMITIEYLWSHTIDGVCLVSSGWMHSGNWSVGCCVGKWLTAGPVAWLSQLVAGPARALGMAGRDSVANAWCRAGRW
jgi:hypothetical protein